MVINETIKPNRRKASVWRDFDFNNKVIRKIAGITYATTIKSSRVPKIKASKR